MGTKWLTGKSVGLLVVHAMLVSSLAVAVDVAVVPQAQAGVTLAMHRLVSPLTGEHFYTASVSEAVNAVRHGWWAEGIGWFAQTGTGSPVYRLAAKPGTGSAGHLYTLSATERSVALGTGQWTDEGIGWYSSGSVPIYREFNPKTGQHNFTADANENKVLTTQQGWNYEGVAWYGVAGAIPSDQTVNLAAAVAFSGPFANDARQSYYIVPSIPYAQESAYIVGAMQNLDNQTDVTIATDTSVSADIYFTFGIYSIKPQSDWYAWTDCTSLASSDVCNHWKITRNVALYHPNETALYCHEIGHSVGLAHALEGDNNSGYRPSEQTCMRGNPDVTQYAAADVLRINERY